MLNKYRETLRIFYQSYKAKIPIFYEVNYNFIYYLKKKLKIKNNKKFKYINKN